MMQFDTIQAAGKERMDALMLSMSALTTGMQTVAAEFADYAKHSFEQGSQAAETLMGVRTLDAAIEVQTSYARLAYDGFVTQAARLGELTAGTAKAAYAPMHGLAPKPFAA